MISCLISDQIIENGDVENHQDEEILEKDVNGIDSTDELIEAQKQLVLLREDISETNGNNPFSSKSQLNLFF
jgi:hypothetical protein